MRCSETEPSRLGTKGHQEDPNGPGRETNRLDFDTVYARYHQKVLRQAGALVGAGAADDVAQLVWMRVYAHLEDFRGLSRVSTWLHVIVRNVATSLVYRPSVVDRGRVPIGEAAGVACERLNPEQLACQEERQRVLQSAMRELTPAHQASVMAALAGLTEQETATLFGIPKATVKSRANRARASLSARLRDRLGERAPAPRARQRARQREAACA
jgi:RNA polymerase sigma-70 factor, ECF subfamily